MTGTIQPNPARDCNVLGSFTEVPSKATLVQSIKKFIHHSQMVANGSHSLHYRGQWDVDMGFCRQVLDMCLHAHMYTHKQIANDTLVIQKNMRGILPHTDNIAYESSLHNLNNIIAACRAVFEK